MSDVRTEYRRKSDPRRDHDWEAWIDGDEELGTGTGPTEEAALAELADDLEDLRDRPDLATIVREHMRTPTPGELADEIERLARMAPPAQTALAALLRNNVHAIRAALRTVERVERLEAVYSAADRLVSTWQCVEPGIEVAIERAATALQNAMHVARRTLAKPDPAP
jgi:hypothetical protein